MRHATDSNHVIAVTTIVNNPRNRQLQAEPELHRHDEMEENDSSSDHEDGKGMANAPKMLPSGRQPWPEQKVNSIARPQIR